MELVTSRRRHPQGGVSTLLILLAACAFNATADAGPIVEHFDIPAGDAEQTLQQYLAQSKFTTLYLTDDVRGVATRAVNGDLDVVQALRRMLDGTTLEVLEARDGMSVTIRSTRVGPPAPDAAALIKEHLRTYGAPGSAVPERALKSVDPDLEEVVVTGTYLHGVLDLISPVMRYTQREMNQTSYASVPEALRLIPQNFGGAPNENVASVGNFARGTAANLRGLGSGATLVLINGHRLPYSGTEGDFVDVSTIPRSAVDRIEVLPDGASALYGSDAIAGVVNIIMKKDFKGGETQGRIGASPAGANEKLFSQMSGMSWATGNALVSYQYSERTALLAGDRTYLASMDKRPLGGTDHRTYTSAPGNILDPITLLPAFGLQPRADGTTALTDTINLQNQYATYEWLPDRRAHSVFASGLQSIGERFDLFGEVLFNKRDTAQTYFGAEQAIYVPSSNPFLLNSLQGSPLVVVGYNFLNDLGPIHARTSSRTASGTLGINVSLPKRWHLTISESYGREHMDFEVDNQPDQVALAAALSDPNPATAFNPFGDGLHNNPATLEAIRTAQVGNVSSRVKTTSVVSDGPVITLASGQVRLAVGAERREETLDRDVFARASFRRSIDSVFSELSVPIVGNGADEYAVPRVELSLAGRFESYSDFGTTTNPKIGLRWAPLQSIKLRTSWGTSFRAPKLVDLYNTSQNSASLRSVPDPRSPTGSSVVLQVGGNNPDLQEETASTWTAGVDFAPNWIEGLTTSLTYYAINYENQVIVPTQVSQNEILVEENQSASRIRRNPSQEEINAICSSPIFFGQAEQCTISTIAAIVDFRPQNLAKTRVRGLDLKLDQLLDTRYGKVHLGFNGARLLDFERAGSDTAPLVSVLDTVSNPLGFKMRGTVEWHQHGWDLPGFGISAAVDHSSGYDDVLVQPQRAVSSWTTADVRLSYRTGRDYGSLHGVELGLNATNLFDRAPPFVDSEAGFDPANAQPYGRVISFTLQKRW